MQNRKEDTYQKTGMAYNRVTVLYIMYRMDIWLVIWVNNTFDLYYVMYILCT
jgi:hypothetical protein